MVRKKKQQILQINAEHADQNTEVAVDNNVEQMFNEHSNTHGTSEDIITHSSATERSGKKSNERRPKMKIRFDEHNHFPVLSSKSTRCKNHDCHKITRIQCSKCNVHLCLLKNRNCFLDFHVLVIDKEKEKPTKTRKKVNPSIRFSENGHFPIFGIKMNRCKNEKCGKLTRIECSKCGVNLCVVKNRNCYLEYHSL